MIEAIMVHFDKLFKNIDFFTPLFSNKSVRASTARANRTEQNRTEQNLPHNVSRPAFLFSPVHSF